MHSRTGAERRMIKKTDKPLLLVVSAPSGAGKTTLGAMLLKEFCNMKRSVSCTTREKRPGEVPGRDYYFMTLPEFANGLQRGKFLETALVHGHWYGTPCAPVLAALRKGIDVLLVIDVQGAKMIRANIGKGGNKSLKAAFIDVFIVPPSGNELKRRLVKRKQDSPEEIEIRLKNVAREMKSMREFQYVVVNDKLQQAFEQLRAIVVAEHCRNHL